MFVTMKDIDFYYDKNNDTILKDFDLNIHKGQTLSILGESGSGKSTILRLLAGLEKPEKGVIVIGNKIMNNENTFVPPEKREVGMVFQDYALFPHMTVFENISFGINHLSKRKRNEMVMETLNLVELVDHSGKYPHQLSGGQQQRTALARALVTEPKILLLDEPFSNLDTNLKNNIRDSLKEIISKIGITTIIVSHDKLDALKLADQLIVLKEGKIVQKGNPEKLISNPESIYAESILL
ncbi:MAG: ABC transporter ATP-binding protein [Halanaerobiales bacterium]|nr:ABC transporter ATP-binding protein [Halanaerobiales bacterium]